MQSTHAALGPQCNALDGLQTIYQVIIGETMHISEDVTCRQGLKAAQEGVNKLDLRADGQKKVE